MNISDKGLELIKEFEGLRLSAYLDSVGIPTIGYGHTQNVHVGDICSMEQAENWLKEDIRIAERCVGKLVTVSLVQGEFDALCSFVFNLGCGRLRGSTLLRKLNSGDYDGAAAEFKRWNKAGGEELDGLTRRRIAEAERFEETA